MSALKPAGLGRRLRASMQWLFGPAALIFLAIAGWQSRMLIVSLLANANYMPLLASVLLWCCLHCLTPVFSWLVLRASGESIDYRHLLAIHVRRLPARYLPGGIWHTVSRMIDLNARGIANPQLARLLLLENSIPLGAALILGGVCLLLAGTLRLPPLVAVILGLVLLVGIHWLQRQRFAVAGEVLSWHVGVRLSALMVVFWLLAATAFYCYWQALAVAARTEVSALQIGGVYLLAWSVGFVSFFAPQGIGVFETVAALFLHGALSFAGAAVLIAGFRIAILAADLLAFVTLVLLSASQRWRSRAAS